MPSAELELWTHSANITEAPNVSSPIPKGTHTEKLSEINEACQDIRLKEQATNKAIPFAHSKETSNEKVDMVLPSFECFGPRAPFGGLAQLNTPSLSEGLAFQQDQLSVPPASSADANSSARNTVITRHIAATVAAAAAAAMSTPMVVPKVTASTSKTEVMPPPKSKELGAKKQLELIVSSLNFLFSVKASPLPNSSKRKKSITNDEDSLEFKLKKEGLIADPINWLIKQKLLPELNIHLCRMCGLKLMLKDDEKSVDKFSWMCVNFKCARKHSIPRCKLFAQFKNYSLSNLVAIVYHWSFQSCYEEIKKDCNLAPHEILRIWKGVQSVCATEVRNCKLGFQNLVEVSFVKFAKYLIVGAMERGTRFSRLTAFPVTTLITSPKITDTLSGYCKEGTTVITNVPQLDELNKRGVIAIDYDPNADDSEREVPNGHVRGILMYLHDKIQMLFGSCSMDQLNLELLQMVLNNLQWRERYGRTNDDAFWNIIYQVSGKKYQLPYETQIDEKDIFTEVHNYELESEVTLQNGDQCVDAINPITSYPCYPTLITSNTNIGGDSLSSILVHSEENMGEENSTITIATVSIYDNMPIDADILQENKEDSVLLENSELHPLVSGNIKTMREALFRKPTVQPPEVSCIDDNSNTMEYNPETSIPASETSIPADVAFPPITTLKEEPNQDEDSLEIFLIKPDDVKVANQEGMDVIIVKSDLPNAVNALPSPEIVEDVAPAILEINNVAESSASTTEVLHTETEEVTSTVVIEEVAMVSDVASATTTNEDSITATVEEDEVKPVIGSKKPNRAEEAAGPDEVPSTVGTEEVTSTVEIDESIPIVAAEESAPRLRSEVNSPLEDISAAVSGCIPVNATENDDSSTFPTAGTEEPMLVDDIIEPSPMGESESLNKTMSEVSTSTTFPLENSPPILGIKESDEDVPNTSTEGQDVQTAETENKTNENGEATAPSNEGVSKVSQLNVTASITGTVTNGVDISLPNQDNHLNNTENTNSLLENSTDNSTSELGNGIPVTEVDTDSSTPVDNWETNLPTEDHVVQPETEKATKNVPSEIHTIQLVTGESDEKDDDHDKPSTSSFQNHVSSDSIPVPHPTEVSVSDLIAIKTWPILCQPSRFCRSLSALQVEFFEDLKRQAFFLYPEQWFLFQKFLHFSGSCKYCGSTDFVIKRCKSCKYLYGRVCTNMRSVCPISLFKLPKLLQEHNLNSALKIVFHWTAQSDVPEVLESVNVTASCVWDIYTKIREVCSAALDKSCFVLGKEHGVVKSTIVQCGIYFMLLCEDVKTDLRRMKLYKIEELKSCYIVQDLKSWCDKSSLILGYFPPSVEKHLGSDCELLSSVVTGCKAESVEQLTELATTVLITLFDKYINSQVDLKTMQSLVDEVVWRQVYGVSSSCTFVNLFKQIISFDQMSGRTFDEMALDDSEIADDKSSTLTLPNSTDDHCAKDKTFKRVSFCDMADDEKVRKMTERKRKLTDPDNYDDMEYDVEQNSPSTSTSKRRGSFDYFSYEELLKNEVRGSKRKFDEDEEDDSIRLNNHPKRGRPRKFSPVRNKQVASSATFFGSSGTNKTAYPFPIHKYSCFICTLHIVGKMAFVDHVHNHATSNKDNMNEKQARENCKECSLCEMTFQCADDLDKHVTKTHNASLQPYVCEMCNAAFSQYKAVMAHFHTGHINRADLQCPYCLQSFPMTLVSRGFYKTKRYCRHVLNHESPLRSEKIDCLYCSLQFLTESALNYHQKQHHVPRVHDTQGVMSYVSKPTPSPKRSLKDWKQVTQSLLLSNESPEDSIVVRIRSSGITVCPSEKDKDKFTCLECKQPMSATHRIKCLTCHCSYTSYCENAFEKHKHLELPLAEKQIAPFPLKKTGFCQCGLACNDGMKLALHFLTCKERCILATECPENWVIKKESIKPIKIRRKIVQSASGSKGKPGKSIYYFKNISSSSKSESGN